MNVSTRLTYDMCKQVYDSCLLSSVRAAGIPLEQIHTQQLGLNIAYRMKSWRLDTQLFIKFNERFITEHRETDMRAIALFLYKETDDIETKLYLKMKWRF